MGLRSNHKGQHKTQPHLTSDQDQINSVPAYGNRDRQTWHDSNSPSDGSALPRRRLPVDEPLGDNLTREGDGEGGSLTRRQ